MATLALADRCTCMQTHRQTDGQTDNETDTLLKRQGLFHLLMSMWEADDIIINLDVQTAC